MEQIPHSQSFPLPGSPVDEFHIDLPDGNYSIQQHHIGPVSKMLARSFIKNNPIWSQFKVTLPEAEAFFRFVIADHLQSEKRAQAYMGKNTSINYVR